MLSQMSWTGRDKTGNRIKMRLSGTVICRHLEEALMDAYDNNRKKVQVDIEERLKKLKDCKQPPSARKRRAPADDGCDSDGGNETTVTVKSKGKRLKRVVVESD